MSIRKYVSGLLFLMGLMILFSALLLFTNALTSPRIVSQVAEKYKIALIMSLTISFSFGWLVSSLAEYLTKSNYRKIAVLTMFAPGLIFLIFLFTTRITSYFWSLAIYACIAFVLTSQCLRLSVIDLDEVAKLLEHN